MMRYIDRCVDFAVNKVRQWQDEGRNVSQINLIANLAGYSATQQGCLQCRFNLYNFFLIFQL